MGLSGAIRPLTIKTPTSTLAFFASAIRELSEKSVGKTSRVLETVVETNVVVMKKNVLTHH